MNNKQTPDLDLTEFMWLLTTKFQLQMQKQPPEVFLEILQNLQEKTCARVFFLIK